MSSRKWHHKHETLSPQLSSRKTERRNLTFRSPPDRSISRSSHIRFDDSDSSDTPSPIAQGVKRPNGQVQARKNRSRDLSSSSDDSESSSIITRKSTPKSSKKRKRMDTIETQLGGSPFLPDAVSTPIFAQPTRATPKAPVLIPVPIDPRLTEAYIEALKQKSRKEAGRSVEQIFRARAPSPTSSEDEVPQVSNKKRRRRKKVKEQTETQQLDGMGDGRKHQTQRAKIQPVQKSEASSQKVEHDSKAETSTIHTTKQINAALETKLLASLTKLVPAHLVTNSRAQLAEEIRQAADSNKGNHDYPANSSGPSDKAVILRAARDLIVKQSAIKLADACESNQDDRHQNANADVSNMGSICIESHLARIAGDRAKKIEVLEMEVRGLKTRLSEYAAAKKK